ncbi:MAG: carboxypeptidase regulatory-like domain-containing protein [Ruminococcus sp.]|nr:carboxypeptidase regulatory-like domain-containing protein [Ruminococcus sp.]
MKKRILSILTTFAMVLGFTVCLSATTVSAEDTTYELENISSAPELRKNGIDLKASEVYSTAKELPTQPTVGIAVQMGTTYSYRNAFSEPLVESTESAYVLVDGDGTTGNGTDKYEIYYKSSTWSHFFVHGAAVAYTDEGVLLYNKKGKAATTVAFAQPGGSNVYYDENGNEVEVTDTDNIPDGVTQYFKKAELVDATITGAGTYKAAIVGYNFQDTDDTMGFNMLYLTSNIGYYDGKVANSTYSVDATALITAVEKAKSTLETLKAECEELRADTNYDFEELEANIAALEEAIAAGEAAAEYDGTALESDYHLNISSMTVYGYDSAEAYEAGTPDETYAVPGFITSTSGVSGNYNFSEYNIVNVYSADKGFPNLTSIPTEDEDGNMSGYTTGTVKYDTTDGTLDAIGYSVRASSSGATSTLPTYALEIEFTIAEGDADVFGYQENVDTALVSINTALASASKLISSADTVSGIIYVSDEDATTDMTVVAEAADGTETSVTVTSMGEYTIEGLEAGTYKITISGGKYAPRSYEVEVSETLSQDVYLNPYGDVNGDGKVTTADVGLANSHAKGVTTLIDYQYICVDVNLDGNITTADVGKINSHAKGVGLLW